MAGLSSVKSVPQFDGKRPILTEFFCQIVPGLDRRRLVLGALFDLFDHNDDGVVDQTELACQNWCLYLTENCHFNRGFLSNLSYKWERGGMEGSCQIGGSI